MHKNHEAAFWKIVEGINSNNDSHFLIIEEDNKLGLTRSPLKALEEYGVIGVFTVREIAWGNSGSDREYFKIWITSKGHDWMQGKIEVQKPCNANVRWAWEKCKRHGYVHSREDKND